ncbi:MAG: RNA-binding protein [Peptoniphilaceae bacterium]
MKLNREKLLNFLVDKEKEIVLKQIIDKIEIVLNKHITLFTDFLDPYEVELAVSILNKFNDISYSVYGGYEDSERNIIYIYPSYNNSLDEDIISMLSVKKDFSISHREVLGSLLGLGINRNKIGDILIGKSHIYIFLKKEISDFVKYNLKKISKYNIVFEDNANFLKPIIEFSEKRLILSSLRLDVFLSSALNLSRSNANDLIKNNKIKVNFKLENKPSFDLKEKDLISVKGFGRIIFNSIEGNTKKEKIIIKIKIPK